MSDTTARDLLPCPDGHKTVTIAQWPDADNRWRHHGFCTCCGWRGPSAGSVAEAIAAWNTRASTARVTQAALSAWAERRPARTESERREIMLAAAAHLPPVDGILFEDGDIAALKAAFIHRFDEDLPRTETLFAVAQIGRRIEARHRAAAEAASTAREERLRNAALDALAGWRYIRQHHGDLYGVGWDRVENALSAALSDAGGE